MRIGTYSRIVVYCSAWSMACAVCSLVFVEQILTSLGLMVSLEHGFAPRWLVPRVPEMTSGGLSYIPMRRNVTHTT